MVLLFLISLILPVLSQTETNGDSTILRPGYGTVFRPEGQVVFNVNQLSLLLEIPLAKFSEQDSVPDIFDPLIEQCKTTNENDNAFDLCVRLLAELDMTATHSFQALLTLQQELDNVKLYFPEIRLGLDRMNIPQQFLKTNLTHIFQKEREQMVAVIKHEQEFADQIEDRARMAEMESDPNGPVLQTIGPKSELSPWLEMFPSSAINGSNVYTIAEQDTMATAVDHFKLSMTTLRGALTAQEQSRVIPRSDYVVRRYPNRFTTLAQRRANQQKANLQLGRQLWLAQQNRTNSRTTQELTALYQQLAATLRETTQEMITNFFTAWYERNLQNLRGLRPQTPQLESTASWLHEQIQTFGPLSRSKRAVGIGAAIFAGINYSKIKKLEKNMEIVAKSVAKVSNEVVLVREDMVAVVGTMLRGFWRV